MAHAQRLQPAKTPIISPESHWLYRKEQKYKEVHSRCQDLPRIPSHTYLHAAIGVAFERQIKRHESACQQVLQHNHGRSGHQYSKIAVGQITPDFGLSRGSLLLSLDAAVPIL